ncbi:hypothetical protein, partial [Streptococcus pneumoniae]|uniref:hypothetical protein n=1 Tax=Streptococcus pneumoniae TaxID=1313 RepID=UPI0012D77883
MAGLLTRPPDPNFHLNAQKFGAKSGGSATANRVGIMNAAAKALTLGASVFLPPGTYDLDTDTTQSLFFQN